MTSYSGMAARGREASVATTKGRRKRLAERIEYSEVEAKPYPTVQARLMGSCGHVLLWLAQVPVVNGEPRPHSYLTRRLGRKMTCQHNDCRIPEKTQREPQADDCEQNVYKTQDMAEEGRRCQTRAQWATSEGNLCTRHRKVLIEQGSLDAEDGERIQR